MNIQIAISTILLTLASFAFAEGPENADMPFLYPDKCGEQKSISIPESIEGTSYYFNRDCTIAYIVPPPTGSIFVSKPSVYESMRLCPAYSKSLDTMTRLQTNIDSLIVKQSALKIDDPLRAKYDQTISQNQQLFDKLSKTYTGIAGINVQMILQGSLTPEYMKSVLFANMPLIEKGHIKIRAAPLQKSYLSFNAVIPGLTRTYVDNPVLESNIMGILSKADESQDTRSSVRFDGAASGYAVLSLSGACPLMKGDFKNLSSLVIDSQAASKYLTVTNTMMVPLISSFGYSATLEVKDMTDLMFKKVGTNGKFSASEVTDLALQGSFSEVVSVKSWTFEDLTGQQQTQYDGLISLDNQNKVKAMLIGEYLNKLVQFNVLREVKPLVTPQAGTETETRTRQVCWNNSSFFGLSHDSGCNNVTYEYAVPHDGTSNQQANIIDKIGVLLVDKVEFLHPISRAFTSTFEIKGSAK